ncbi:MAG: DUF3050 domain-containing protein [Magnetococcales bacterium]|nr:DUF3050 domain-containing protein [Magnetococcales bacterium]
MGIVVSLDGLHPLREKLHTHPVYQAVDNLDRLRCFMEHHIFSVWDFMSLLKYLQACVAPARQPWSPVSDPQLRRFINEIVLEEESDLGMTEVGGDAVYASHFELYAQAMREVGADPSGALAFAHTAGEVGFLEALRQHGSHVPEASRQFMSVTFDFIRSDQPHVVAAAFALGREHIIPPMFRGLLKQMAITPERAPTFHYYLERHIHLDSDHHGPLSLQLLNALCTGDSLRIREAESAAAHAIHARITFWDGVLERLSAIA